MKQHSIKPTTSRDFSIKPQDLGFHTETAAEITPSSRAMAQKASPTKVNPGNLRPNIGIYPGE